MLSVLLAPAASEADFTAWFAQVHAPWITELDGIETAGLFSLHEEQSLPVPCPWPMVAIYGLSDAAAALETWSSTHEQRAPQALVNRVARMEAGCWEKMAGPSPFMGPENSSVTRLIVNGDGTWRLGVSHLRGR